MSDSTWRLTNPSTPHRRPRVMDLPGLTTST